MRRLTDLKSSIFAAEGTMAMALSLAAPIVVCLALSLGISPNSAFAQASPAPKNGCATHLLSPVISTEKIDGLVEKHLPWTQELFQKIRKIHGIADSHFVFVGRSPTMLAAYLEASKGMFPDIQTSILPISLTRGLAVSRSEAQQRFSNVYKAFVNPNDSTKRKLVFVDFISNGRTFSELEKLLLAEGITEAHFLGFTHNVALAKAYTKNTISHFPIEILPISLGAELNLGEHKPLSPYPSHKILSEEYPTNPQLDKNLVHPNYQTTILSIQQEIFF